MPTHHLTQKVCNFATVMRDDGVSYGDYLEQAHSCSSSLRIRGVAQCSSDTAILEH